MGYDQAETMIEYGPAPVWTAGTRSDSGIAPWTNHRLAFDSHTVPAHAGSHLTGAARRSGSSLQTLALSASSHALGGGNAWIQSNVTSHVYGMTLSPHTALRLTFQVEVNSSLTVQPTLDDSGYAGSTVRIDFTSVGEFEDAVQSHLLYHAVDGVTEFGTAGTQFVTIDFTNASDIPDNSILSLVANAYSFAPAAPVPEPSSYTMLAAGLGMLGAVGALRRRRPLRPI